MIRIRELLILQSKCKPDLARYLTGWISLSVPFKQAPRLLNSSAAKKDLDSGQISIINSQMKNGQVMIVRLRGIHSCALVFQETLSNLSMTHVGNMAKCSPLVTVRLLD